MGRLLEGKTAFVTGASYGIGKAVAIAFAREGCNLVLFARNAKGVEETAKRVKAENVTVKTIIGDATNWTQVQDIAANLDSIDILYNGIANWVDKSFLDATAQEIEETIDSVYKANLLVTKAFLPMLINSKGTIITIVSDWGLVEVKDKPALFGSAKVAVGVFADLLRQEISQKGVRVINVYPTEVASSLDIDDLTHKDKSIRLFDLTSSIISLFSSKKDATYLYISNLKNKLETVFK